MWARWSNRPTREGARAGAGRRRQGRQTTGGNALDRPGYLCSHRDRRHQPVPRILQEEIFGPFAPIIKYPPSKKRSTSPTTPSSAGGYVFREPGSDAGGPADQTGMIGINAGVISDAAAPFGGVKMSRPGTRGLQLGIENTWRPSTTRCPSDPCSAGDGPRCQTVPGHGLQVPRRAGERYDAQPESTRVGAIGAQFRSMRPNSARPRVARHYPSLAAAKITSSGPPPPPRGGSSGTVERPQPLQSIPGFGEGRQVSNQRRRVAVRRRSPWRQQARRRTTAAPAPVRDGSSTIRSVCGGNPCRPVPVWWRGSGPRAFSRQPDRGQLPSIPTSGERPPAPANRPTPQYRSGPPPAAVAACQHRLVNACAAPGCLPKPSARTRTAVHQPAAGRSSPHRSSSTPSTVVDWTPPPPQLATSCTHRDSSDGSTGPPGGQSGSHQRAAPTSSSDRHARRPTRPPHQVPHPGPVVRPSTWRAPAPPPATRCGRAGAAAQQPQAFSSRCAAAPR